MRGVIGAIYEPHLCWAPSISLTPNAFRIRSAHARQTVLVGLSNAMVRSVPEIFLAGV